MVPYHDVNRVFLHTLDNSSLTSSQSSSNGAPPEEIFVIFLATSFFIISAAALRMAIHSRMVTGINGGWAGHGGYFEIQALSRSFSPTYGTSLPLSPTLVEANGQQQQEQDGSPSYETLLEIGEVLGSVKQGLTDDQIKVLPTYRFNRNNIGNGSSNYSDNKDHPRCAICRDDFGDMDVITVLPCNDEFHADCVKRWLNEQASCPLCRNRFA